MSLARWLMGCANFLEPSGCPPWTEVDSDARRTIEEC